MSFVLEALKRADAERGRGAVPDLHAQAQLPPDDAADAATRQRPWWIGAVALALVATAAVIGWLARPMPAAPPAAGAGASVTTAPATPTPQRAPGGPADAAPAARVTADAPPAARVQADATPTPVVPIEAQPAQRVPAEPPPTLRVQPLPAPQAATSRVRAQPAASAARADAPADAPPQAQPAAPPSAAPAPTAAQASTTARVPTLAELPEALRRELPALAVGGSVYSTQPSQRLLILNGQVLHEGDRLNANLMLETIRPKSAVLKLREQRFEISY